MRVRVMLVVCLLLLTPVFFLHAAEVDSKKQEDQKPAYEGVKDQCLSETVSVEDGELVTKEGAKDTAAYKQCRQANDNKGCTTALEKEGKCKCGTVTYTVTPDGKPCQVSKCAENYDEEVQKCAAGADTSALKDLKIRDLARDAISISTPNSQLEGVLKAFGVSDTEARSAVASNKTQVIDLLRKAASGDTAGAQAIAKTLNLNPDLFNDVARLQPGDRLAKFAPALNEADKYIGQRILSGQTGFTDKNAGNAVSGLLPRSNTVSTAFVYSDIERAKCAIASIESGSCGGNYGAVGPRTRTGSRALGKYQVMDFNVPSWSARACGRAYTASQFLADSSCQERVFEVVFGSYAQECGYEGAALRWFTGSCSPRSNPSDGGLYASQYLARFRQVFEGGSIPFGGTAVAYTGQRSPFGNSSPFGAWSSSGITSGVNTAMPVGVPGGGVTPGGGYQLRGSPEQRSTQTAPTKSGENIKEKTSSGTSTKSVLERARSAVKNLFDAINPSDEKETETISPVDPVSTLFVQPQTITRGEPLLVSWSSLGMSALTPCRVLVTSGSVTSLIAEGNDGSERIATDNSQPSGVWKFMLRCTAQRDGSIVDQEADVTVE